MRKFKHIFDIKHSRFSELQIPDASASSSTDLHLYKQETWDDSREQKM